MLEVVYVVLAVVVELKSLFVFLVDIVLSVVVSVDTIISVTTKFELFLSKVGISFITPKHTNIAAHKPEIVKETFLYKVYVFSFVQE